MERISWITFVDVFENENRKLDVDNDFNTCAVCSIWAANIS